LFGSTTAVLQPGQYLLRVVVEAASGSSVASPETLDVIYQVTLEEP
jgi:hypothetical protein